ncbi:MAG: type II toxin-antitoxin system MazE family antitoxin [Candidatus Scalindua sp.]
MPWVIPYSMIYLYDNGGGVMTNRATFTIEDEAFAFLNSMANNNRSAYINRLLKKEKQRILEKAIMKANQEEAEDLEYQEELSDWEETLSDGLEA